MESDTNGDFDGLKIVVIWTHIMSYSGIRKKKCSRVTKHICSFSVDNLDIDHDLVDCEFANGFSLL